MQRVEHNGAQCETQAAIEAALFPINKAKVHSSEDTTFLQEPLYQTFGPRGNPELEDQVLNGSYSPPDAAPPYAKLFLSHCTLPESLPSTDTCISTENHKLAWKKAKERTSGGMSKLTFAMYKAAASKKGDPLLTQLRTPPGTLTVAGSSA